LALEALAIGDPAEIAGYRLRGRLGAGGMGRVYLAFTRGGRPVALKVVRAELGDDPDFRVRFRQEIEAARRVHGLFTAQLLDGDPDASPPWLVAAYVVGPSLAQAVADHGPMPADSVFLLMAGVAEALAAIHGAGVVHRDLKPSNVLLAADGPRVIDFGIARAVEATSLTRTGMRVGSPQYMSPEQVRGGTVTGAADVFALGALTAFAVTGHAPFGTGSEEAVLYRVLHTDPDLGDCPAPLRAVIGSCLAKDAAARPSPAELIESCRELAAVKTVEFSESWLPPAMAAELTRHAAPAPPALPATVSAAPGLPAAGAPAGQAPPGQGPAGQAPGGQAPAELVTAADTGAGSPSPPRQPGWHGLSRTAVICAGSAVLILAALAAYGLNLATSGGHNGTHRGAGRSAAGLSSATGGRARKDAPASPSPTPVTLAQCLIGTWTETSEDDPSTFNGDPVVWSGGPGVTQIFEPNGTNIFEFHDARFTLHFNGNTWTDVDNGRASVHYTVQNGMLLSSNLSASGTVDLLENGALDKSSPLTLNLEPDNVTCSGNTLQLYATDGTSASLTREVPKPSGS
jgi:Protein kinase domain